MTHWSQRLPAPILSEMMATYGTDHITVDHIVDWLLTQELSRQKEEKFTFKYDRDTLVTNVGDANESYSN